VITSALFVLGLVLLLAGGEVLIRGATRLAAMASVPPVIIGLTVVAFSTSAPELAVAVQAAIGGHGDLVVGNVVGSNIANVLLIIGLAVGVWWMALDGRLSTLEGVLLVAGIIAYGTLAVRASRTTARPVRDQYAEAYGEPGALGRGAWPATLLLVALGIAGLVVGAHWLVGGATAAARALGVSELVIGLTIVAVGTSLPELTTSVMAALKGERDIAAGNAIGSNIFNLLLVLGLTALATPGGVPVSRAAAAFDLPVMVAASVACLPIFFFGHRISRWEGTLFVAYYAAYIAYLLLDSTWHQALGVYSAAMTWFVLPLSGVTLFVVWYRMARDPDQVRAGEAPTE
jgi:cation:H+ antiporter